MEQNVDFNAKTDEELVELVLTNEDNFSYLIKRYEGKLISYILRISNISFEEAEDILQEVFIKVYQNINEFDPSLKFSSWIYRITHNQVISNFRKNKARPQSAFGDVSDEKFHNLASDLDIIEEADQKILQKNIKKILEKIDIKYREVLVLKFIEEKSYQEISDILKKPMGTVATLINRAKKEFQKELDKQEIDLK